ncbi:MULTISPECIES: hypothetical protein [unclassified Haladaptatus]|uniref:hypothetical protein n=1 Tax=unclassified Haladaptatus TaxID=2622732 RepID=UPI0023E8E9D7|nr:MULTISPECIES: hypothetical protein [unclassified Haladaptatus]
MNDQTAVNTVEEYCMFGEERVYLFMAIARQKENPHLTSSTEVTFREVVTDTQDIRRKFDQLQSWAQHYRTESGDPLAFRLYLSVNARNTVDGFFNFQEQTNGWIRAWLKGDETAPRKFKRLSSYWKSELQKPTASDDSRFLFDLDDTSEEDAQRLLASLEKQTSVVTVRESPNGYHIVTEPFNYTTLDIDVEYDLKTDGMLFVGFLSDSSESDG